MVQNYRVYMSNPNWLSFPCELLGDHLYGELSGKSAFPVLYSDFSRAVKALRQPEFMPISRDLFSKLTGVDEQRIANDLFIHDSGAVLAYHRDESHELVRLDSLRVVGFPRAVEIVSKKLLLPQKREIKEGKFFASGRCTTAMYCWV